MNIFPPKIYYNKLINVFHPERYQGLGKQRRYFEGWYFKVLNADTSRAFAFIPGIAMDENGYAQAFIQVLDGIKKTASYHQFDSSLFKPLQNKFYVEIGNNNFSREYLKINLDNCSGELKFKNQIPWPNSIFSPGIMGPFTFVPFMECYHGIVSMDHLIEGSLIINGEHIDMNGGRGYIEKDWGRSFPSAYIWMQSNHFSIPGISLKCSVANIPWLKSSFVGFIAGLSVEGKLFQFTTYNGTSLHKCYADQNNVEIIIENKKYRLEIFAQRDHATALASPIMGMMSSLIEESMTSHVTVRLLENKSRKIIFEDQSNRTAIEVAGKIDSILK